MEKQNTEKLTDKAFARLALTLSSVLVDESLIICVGLQGRRGVE